MAVNALELRPRGAIALMDAALRLCSRDGGLWALTLPGGAAVIAALLYLGDAVEYGRPLALPSLLLTLAWLVRGLGQGAASHRVQALLLGPGAEPGIWESWRAARARAPSLVITVAFLLAFNVLSLSLTLGIGYFFLSAHTVGYAAAMQGRGHPLGLYGQCSRLLGPARGTATAVRILMWVQVLVFLNLHIGINFLLLVARKLLGIDLTFAERFASLDNARWLLFLAAVTFTLFEPARAAAATLLLVDGRVRQEGLDLLAAVQQLPQRGAKPRSSGGAVAAGLVVALLVGWLVPTTARAQAPDTESSDVDLSDSVLAEDEPGAKPAPRPRPSRLTAIGQKAEDPSAPVEGGEALRRLMVVAQRCDAADPAEDGRYAALEKLGPGEAVKLGRLVRAVERQAYDEEDCEAASATLEMGLTEAADTAAVESRVDSLGAATRAKEILARPEFAVAPPKAEQEPKEDAPREPPGWWKRFMEWLNEWLKKLFERDRTPPPLDTSPPLLTGGAVANALVLVLVGLALVVLAFVLVRAFQRKRDAEQGLAVEVSTVDAAALAGREDHALSRPPEGWARLADELAARGEYREAVRSLYLALLSRLHRDGAILYDVTLSNWDYLRQYRGRSDWKAPFRELTLRFDYAWYGSLPVGQDGYRAFRALTAPLLNAPSPSEAAGA